MEYNSSGLKSIAFFFELKIFKGWLLQCDTLCLPYLLCPATQQM